MEEKEQNNQESKANKFLIGPGSGLVLMGFAYIIWWFAGPWAWEAIATDPRWVHNWAYAIIIFNVGLAWYHISPLTRVLAMIQSFMLPITASGSFNTTVCTIISALIFIVWGIIVLIEHQKGTTYLTERLSKRGKIWMNMHCLVIAWILIAHMGLMFFIVRLPLEFPLYQIANNAGFLTNLPPEGLEFSTWVFDIGLFIFFIFVIREQYRMGYNLQNKSWPKLSFIIAIIVMGVSLLALLIQDLTIGFDWVGTFYG
ncbi:MAG: hypothetical protein KGD67_00705 [Candidatus Lokiarchaeota archaeon]|nr:hypothetical protein [Candidatus Lokiarchaeota archaeon]